jgi:hypothetical protein
VRLTKVQSAMLLYMLEHGAYFAERSDRTLQAMLRRDLAYWYAGRKYSRARWFLTCYGAEVARKLKNGA